MRVGVVGTGYVGLVLGAGLADSGNRVICGDIDKAKIDMLNHGEIPIFEPGLAEMVARNSSHGRLTFTTDIPQLVRDSDVIFIAVGTPPSEDGSADLGHVLNVAATIADNMDGYRLVVVKSTVPVGTCDKVREVIASRTKHIFDVASNPEFLKEGEAVRDMMKPDRIVIGTDNERARELLEEVYVTFVRTGNPIIFMDIKSSEMTKYASNAMLATRISFMNEMASICTKIGADIDMVRHGMGADPRIGSRFLFAGVGYGGSCFPKDVKALIATGVDNGLEVPLLHAVEHINAKQKTLLVDMVVDHFGEDLSGLKFAMWGLSFKPNTDDMREAPSIEIIKGLTAKGATVVATDPVAMENAAVILKGNERVSFLADEYEAVSGVDALLLVTEWGTFRAPSFSRLATAMKQKVIFDGRNIWQPAKLREMGFEYYGIGRP
ncbi:MAG: UDP-glucose dehydrogenase family protein [Myxococcota bacterium]|nr:UDP-glucose/GDP-mannose dehydrogenase family protein [Myxococcota bacterium]MBP8971313.1 UDP-glucose/GDP-mannose dehydrogenase family protein [Myxococcota bacterium]OQC43036.1 MAG: UDP-glucose 6-dehydrogenase TuaD [Deltaproteobacteria bacterium ADurb.Bin058]HHW96376.1 UDP-glucose/GDP-mannose dehydrogenase family protein [Oligoflexales bacterium]HQL58237.1 UDP-glucose/GDP-mannose dehydrogenase family protein [Myxococcota bacterium]